MLGSAPMAAKRRTRDGSVRGLLPRRNASSQDRDITDGRPKQNCVVTRGSPEPQGSAPSVTGASSSFSDSSINSPICRRTVAH